MAGHGFGVSSRNVTVLFGDTKCEVEEVKMNEIVCVTLSHVEGSVDISVSNYLYIFT